MAPFLNRKNWLRPGQAAGGTSAIDMIYPKPSSQPCWALAPASIALYELDRNRPALEQLVKLAEFFGVTTDALLGRADLKTDAGNAAAAIFRRLPPQKRKVALSMLHALEAG